MNQTKSTLMVFLVLMIPVIFGMLGYMWYVILKKAPKGGALKVDSKWLEDALGKVFWRVFSGIFVAIFLCLTLFKIL